eukprot:s203_g17.t1
MPRFKPGDFEECTWSESRIADLVAKRGPMLNRTELKDVFQRCMLSGAAAIAKVVVKAEAREDNWTVQEVGKATTPDSAAFIGLCLGEAGKLSRVLNQVMCPSMHPSLAPGAPGQMSVTELLETRQTLGLMGTSRQFAVIGPWEGEAPKTGATASLFLRLLQAAFKALQLPHVVVRDFARTSEEASRLLALASTGGAVLLGPLTTQLASEAWADVSFVDCVERLQPLGSKRTAAILGERGDPAACVAGLNAVGFQRIVTATPCEEPDVEVVKDLDALIYMGMEMQLEKLQQSLTEICQSNKPMAPTWLSEVAKKSDCQMVSSEVFLLEEMLAWFRAWHIEAKADVLKEVVAKELVNFREASQQARQAWT